VTSYYGFELATPEPVRQREGPGVDVVVIFTFEEHWLIDGVRHTSFVGGLHERQVTTEHPGDAGRRDRAAAEAVARLLRFERARELAGTMPWGELAFECGFSDHSDGRPGGSPRSRRRVAPWCRDAGASSLRS
jgi:hypothetical protein